MKIYLGNKGDTELDLDDDDTIQVRPLAKYTGGIWNIRRRKAFRVEIYDGFTKTQKYIYYKNKTRYDTCMKYDTMEEARRAAEDYYKEHNKVWKDTLLKLKVKDLTATIMERYRFVQSSIDYPYQDVPLDPMFLGLWLGDGTSRCAQITNIDEEIIEYTKKIAAKYNLRVNSNEKGNRHHIARTQGHHNEVLDLIRKMNLICNKHIPECYMKNSTKVRLEVLAGLIDTDGYLCSNTYEISQKSNRLAQDIVDLAMSVGIYAENREKIAYASNTVEKKRHKYNRIFLHVPSMDLAPPVMLSRKDYQQPVVNYGIQMSLMRNENFRHDWTPEKKLELFKIASNYIEKSGRVQWKVIVENEPNFATFTPQSLRVCYHEYIKDLESDKAS